MTDGGQQTTDDRLQTADGRRRQTAAGRRRWTADGRRQTADGRRRIVDGRRRTADGRRQTIDGRRQKTGQWAASGGLAQLQTAATEEPRVQSVDPHLRPALSGSHQRRRRSLGVSRRSRLRCVASGLHCASRLTAATPAIRRCLEDIRRSLPQIWPARGDMRKVMPII